MPFFSKKTSKSYKGETLKKVVTLILLALALGVAANASTNISNTHDEDKSKIMGTDTNSDRGTLY